MNFFLHSLVLTIFILAGSGSCFIIQQNLTDEKTSIIGGVYSNVIIPYHVYMTCNDEYFCGGALISEQHVLTAAHCIKFVQPKNCLVKVFAGSTSRHRGQYILVASFMMHPQYSSSSHEHDIGVLKLNHPFIVSNMIYPINLTPYAPRSGELITIAGFGRLYRYNNDLSEILKTYTSWLMTYPECYKRLNSFVHPSDICDYGQTHQSVCEGDSGTPVVNSLYIVGVVSRGMNFDKPEDPVQGCGIGYPAIFTSVYYHLDFIKACLRT